MVHILILRTCSVVLVPVCLFMLVFHYYIEKSVIVFRADVTAGHGEHSYDFIGFIYAQEEDQNNKSSFPHSSFSDIEETAIVDVVETPFTPVRVYVPGF